MKRSSIVLGVLFLSNAALGAEPNAPANPKPSALDIIKKVETRRLPDNAKSKVTLIIDRGGSKVEKVFHLTTFRVSKDETYSLVEFEKPSNTKVLAHLRTTGEDDRWIKTSSGQPKKIASGGEDQSFAQSHFTYEDLQFAKGNDFDSELLCESDGKCEVTHMGAPHYKLKLKPKSQEKQYGYIIGLVRVSDYLPTKSEYYTKDGKLIKELSVDKIKDMPEGEKDPNKVYPTPESITLKMADGSGSSTLLFSNGLVNSPSIKKQTFDKNLL
jgi:hypothetical protein